MWFTEVMEDAKMAKDGYLNAMLKGKFVLFRNACFLVRPDVGAYSYAGRIWRSDRKEVVTEKRLNIEGYVRVKTTI